MQYVLTSINTLSLGLEKVGSEVSIHKELPLDAEDGFIRVMEPFFKRMQPIVSSIKAAGDALNSELKELLDYFGEASDGPEGTKPEDFFKLILSFSSALQVIAFRLCVRVLRIYLESGVGDAREGGDEATSSHSICICRDYGRGTRGYGQRGE